MTIANGKQVFEGSVVTVNYYGQILTGVVEDMRRVYTNNDLRFNLRFAQPTEVMGDVRSRTVIDISKKVFFVDVAA